MWMIITHNYSHPRRLLSSNFLQRANIDFSVWSVDLFLFFYSTMMMRVISSTFRRRVIPASQHAIISVHVTGKNIRAFSGAINSSTLAAGHEVRYILLLWALGVLQYQFVSIWIFWQYTIEPNAKNFHINWNI